MRLPSALLVEIKPFRSRASLLYCVSRRAVGLGQRARVYNKTSLLLYETAQVSRYEVNVQLEWK